MYKPLTLIKFYFLQKLIFISEQIYFRGSQHVKAYNNIFNMIFF